MNISLRPSGGRGEYEFAGTHGAIAVSEVLDLDILIELFPNVIINANARCLRKDGKPRIRLTKNARNAHPSVLISKAMLLPNPRREKELTGGSVLLRKDEFVIQAVRVDVNILGTKLLISPVIVRAENGDGQRKDIVFADRMSRVLKAWKVANSANGALAEAVRKHEKVFSSIKSQPKDFNQAYSLISQVLGNPVSDLLPLVESELEIYGADVAVSDGDYFDIQSFTDLGEDVMITPEEARIERVRRWRLASQRGSSSTKFRRDVREAYEYKCAFTGMRLPVTELSSSPGVDAAHILPWSKYDLDSATNGLCLNKLAHWAFDEGLVRMTYKRSNSAYELFIPNKAKLAAHAAKFDLAPFERMEGTLPLDRLPSDRTKWPSGEYLDELNSFLDNKRTS